MRKDDAPVSLAQLRTRARTAEKSRRAADGNTLRAVFIFALCVSLGLAFALALWLP